MVHIGAQFRNLVIVPRDRAVKKICYDGKEKKLGLFGKRCSGKKSNYCFNQQPETDGSKSVGWSQNFFIQNPLCSFSEDSARRPRKLLSQQPYDPPNRLGNRVTDFIAYVFFGRSGLACERFFFGHRLSLNNMSKKLVYR